MTEPVDSQPLVSFVISTMDRRDDLVDAIESVLDQRYRPIEIVVVSNSTEAESALFERGGRFAEAPVQYHHYDERMGIPKARNVGFEHAEGEYFVLIDDDATLASPEATDRIVSLFDEHDAAGILAFQSRSDDTGELRLHEIPSSPDFQFPPTKQMYVSSFCGVGSAFRRSVIEELGGFPDEFIYGFEEQDLSIRSLNAGYDILYAPSIVVYHKKSSDGRRPEIETRMHRIENRIRIALRNLPRRYVVCTLLLYSVYALVSFQLDPRHLLRMYYRLFDQRHSLLSERSVIDSRTITLLKARHSMLFGWWYGPHPRRILNNPNRLRW